VKVVWVPKRVLISPISCDGIGFGFDPVNPSDIISDTLFIYIYNYIYTHTHYIPVVPHKAVAEVSKIGNLYERLVVVNQGWQRDATEALTGGLGRLSFSLFL
jgi:hypothetical protein